MRTQTVRVVTAAVLLAASGRAATVMAGPGMKRNIVGVITTVERHSPPTLGIKTNGGTLREVHADEKTQYVKWTTHKEGPQDSSVDAAVVGRCVDVEPRTGNPKSAKVVRISDEPAGSPLDPCKAMR